MSDLISRQSALDAIQKRADIINSVYSAFREGLIIAYSLVQETPSAEPERKKGEWIEQDDGWDGIYYECSECREAFTLMDGTPTDNLYNFCPNCGADMRGDR